MESWDHLSHLHRHRGSLTKQLTSEEGRRQLVPVTHTKILCSFQWSGVFPLMSFLQLLLSFIAPPGPHYASDSKATCLHQQLCDFYLWNKLHGVPINNKGPASLSALLFFPFLCSKPVCVLSWECFWLSIISATFLRFAHRRTVRYRQERVLIYSTCFHCPWCDIYSNMGACVIRNPDCDVWADSCFSAVQCLQNICWVAALWPLLHLEQLLSLFWKQITTDLVLH